jgi:hypothetical protein
VRVVTIEGGASDLHRKGSWRPSCFYPFEVAIVFTNTIATKPALAAVDQYVSIEAARELVGRRGKPAARQTVLALGLRGELEIRRIGARFVVTRASIERYRARRGLS